MYVSIVCDVLFNLCAALLGVGLDNIVSIGGDQGLYAQLNHMRLLSGQKGDLYPFPHPDSIPVDQLIIASVAGPVGIPFSDAIWVWLT